MSARLRLLFLCHTLPHPPDSGMWIRTYHVLRLLARTFEVTALCFERSSTSVDGTLSYDAAASSEALARFSNIEVFPLPQNHSRARFVWDHVRSTATGRVYTAYRYESDAYEARLAHVLRTTRFDLVHSDSLDLSRYLPLCGDLPIVCVHHNVESELLWRRAAVEDTAWRRAYLAYQARLMETEQRRWCERVALNVVVSDRDRQLLQRLAPRARIAVVPNGVDVDEFRPADMPGAGVAFVGGINGWFPNLDALDFFCERILPRLRRADAHVPVRWIGEATAEQQRRYGERFGIELTGYVADTRPLLRDAACHIVPLRVGGGTRLKILNSWAMGKPVVTTSIGCEGLDARDGDNLLIRDDPQAFADAILAVLRDAPLRERLGVRGRSTAERCYSWEAIGPPMAERYLQLATN